MSITKYMGPAFTLVMMLGSAATSAVIAASTHNVPATIPTTLMSVGCAVLVVKDWNNTWKPLFTKKR